MSDNENKKEKKNENVEDESDKEKDKIDSQKENSEANKENDTKSINSTGSKKLLKEEKNDEIVGEAESKPLQTEITAESKIEEVNIKKTNDMIRDIMAEEQKKNVENTIQEHTDKKFSKKTMIKKIPFSFSNFDVYFHLKYQHVNLVLRVLVESLFVACLFLIWPIIGVALFSKSNKKITFLHHFLRQLTPDDEASQFLRNNLFFTIGYIVYVFMSLFTDNILYIIAIFFTTFGLSIQGVVAEYLQVIRASRKHLKNAIVAIIMFWIGTVLLYDYVFLANDKNLCFLCLTSLFWWSIISFILFFESFLMNLLTSELRRKSFKGRIWDTNYKTFIIKKLAAIAEATPYGKHRVNEIIYNLENEYDTGFFLRHNDLDLTTAEAAETISEGVFGYLEIDELTYDNIKTYFPDNYEEVYSYLNATKVTKDMVKFPAVEYETFNMRCIELYQERTDISRSLYDRDNILRKLDYILTTIVVFFSCMILMILLNVDYKVYLASLGPLTFGFGWIFQDSIKEIYRCFVFLLINHPFDCGDRIKIDSEEFLVLRIDLLYTTCTTINGKIKYLPNAALFLKYIENIRRSDIQAEDILLNVGGDTKFVQMLQVRDKLTEFAKRNDKDFTGIIYLKNYESAGDMMKVIFTIEHTSNFQDIKPRLMRRDLFVKKLEEILDDEKIKYTRCYTARD